MNSTCGRHWMVSLLLAGLAAAVPVRGEDAPTSPPSAAAAPTNAAVAFTLSPPATPVVPSEQPAAPVAADAGIVPPGEVVPGVSVEQVPASGYTTGFGLDTPAAGAAAEGEDAEAQSRLSAPTPEQIIEEHGAVGFLIRQPEARNFLEMINPFAPEEFGPGEREIYNRDPNLAPGATLPRTFINDMTHEPVLSFWNWAW